MKEEYMKCLGANIRYYRLEKGLTQRTLAEEAGVAVSFLNDVESGKSNVSINWLYQVASILDVDLSTLFQMIESEVKD